MSWHFRFGARLTAVIILLMPGVARGQASGPVATAFREFAHDIHEKIQLAAEAMPAEQYAFKPTAAQPTFAEILRSIGERDENLCSAIGGIKESDHGSVTGALAKDSLLPMLRSTSQWCEVALRGLDDTRLSEPIDVDLRIERVAPNSLRPRSTAITGATAYWADAYQQLVQYLRLDGRVPPKPCGGVNNDASCGSGRNFCQARPTPGIKGLKFELSDGPSYSVRSDGLGPYVAGRGNVATVWAGYATVMVLGPSDPAKLPHRSVSIDLNHPVPGDIGVPRGVVVDDHNMEVGAQWFTNSAGEARSVIDIPVGATVDAAQADVEFHINGVTYGLQMGPQPGGHCFSDGTAEHGAGTSHATITRVDEETFVVDLPVGSIGRLFDVHLSYPNAVDLGLYYVSMHFVLRR